MEAIIDAVLPVFAIAASDWRRGRLGDDAMGLFMVGKRFRGDIKEIGFLATLKPVVHPLLAWGMLRLVPLDAARSKSLRFNLLGVRR